MPKLFIIAGASGAGKSFLLEALSNTEQGFDLIKKLTDRSHRPYENSKEDLDLIFGCDKEQIKAECEFRYLYDGNIYGIRVSDIRESISSGKNPFVIVRDGETIVDLKRAFPNSSVIFLQTALSGADLAEKLRTQGRPDIEIEKRMLRHRRDFDDYVKHIHMFDRVLINYFEPETLISQAKVIIRAELDAQPEVVSNDVFVLMSFSAGMKPVYEAIKLAFENYNLRHGTSLNVWRIDDKRGSDYPVNEEILSAISCAKFVIADLSEERPNVYFELGYAKGLNKRVLSIARKGTKLHFDVSVNRSLMYDSETQLQLELRKEIEAVISDLRS